MRYLDSSTGNPADTLGGWLLGVDPASVTAISIQAGFFGSEALPYLAPILDAVTARNGSVTILIGSNDGRTTRTSIELLLDATGPDRTGLRLGIVRFGNAFFHAKTVHLRCTDHDRAYVGSSNLTLAGAGALHIEAGIALSGDVDPANELRAIERSTDRWFTASADGLIRLDSATDLAALVATGKITDALPRGSGGAAGTGPVHPRRRLVLFPPHVPRPTAVLLPETHTIVSIPAPGSSASWSKKITRTDAQRKAGGNQSGGIHLTQAEQPINAQTWFRDDLFVSAAWAPELTRTARTKEVATVLMDVEVLGDRRGRQPFRISHDPLRASGQGNYTSLLHLDSLSDDFHATDFTDAWIHLARDVDGRFSLRITPPVAAP